jgi:hypothetical protein
MSPARRSGQEVLKSRGGNAEWSAPSQSWGHTCPAVLLGTAAPDLNLALGPEGMCICTELRSNTQHLLDTREGAHYAAILVSATGLAASTCQFSATHPRAPQLHRALCRHVIYRCTTPVFQDGTRYFTGRNESCTLQCLLKSVPAPKVCRNTQWLSTRARWQQVWPSQTYAPASVVPQNRRVVGGDRGRKPHQPL